jgi:hypothetical protein
MFGLFYFPNISFSFNPEIFFPPVLSSGYPQVKKTILKKEVAGNFFTTVLCGVSLFLLSFATVPLLYTVEPRQNPGEDGTALLCIAAFTWYQCSLM